MSCLRVTALLWKSIPAAGIAAFKTSFLRHAKYNIAFSFQSNGISLGIMKDNFSFFRF